MSANAVSRYGPSGKLPIRSSDLSSDEASLGGLVARGKLKLPAPGSAADDGVDFCQLDFDGPPGVLSLDAQDAQESEIKGVRRL